MQFIQLQRCVCYNITLGYISLVKIIIAFHAATCNILLLKWQNSNNINITDVYQCEPNETFIPIHYIWNTDAVKLVLL